MKKLTRALAAVLILVICLGLAPAAGAASGCELGSSSLDILNGGRMVTSGANFCYYNDYNGGVYVSSGGYDTLLCYDEARNMNISGGSLYYTVGGALKRISLGGGEAQTVFDNGADISQLYIVDGAEARYISGGRAYSRALDGASAQLISELEGIMGLIPTEYGNIFATGSVFDYTIYAGASRVLDCVQSYYTDSGYLVVNIDTQDYMVSLASLFSGSFALEDFSLHGQVSLDEFFDIDESGFDESAYYAMLAAEGETLPENDTPLIPTVSQGQLNMVKRARQLHEIAWTPIYDRYQWGYRGVFTAGQGQDRAAVGNAAGPASLCFQVP